MNIIVFGASRGTGFQIVKQSLEAGHFVTALARNISSMEDKFFSQQNRDRLKIIKGDVLIPSTFEKKIIGKDVIISAFGVSNRKPTRLYSDGITNISNAMLKNNVNRLIVISAIGVEITPGMPAITKFVMKFILQPLLKNNFSDLLKMESIIKQKNLNWTIVRPPRLTNGKLTGKYRFASNNYIKNPISLSRSNLAHFIVHNINNKNIYCSKVEISR